MLENQRPKGLLYAKAGVGYFSRLAHEEQQAEPPAKYYPILSKLRTNLACIIQIISGIRQVCL